VKTLYKTGQLARALRTPLAVVTYAARKVTGSAQDAIRHRLYGGEQLAGLISALLRTQAKKLDAAEWIGFLVRIFLVQAKEAREDEPAADATDLSLKSLRDLATEHGAKQHEALFLGRHLDTFAHDGRRHYDAAAEAGFLFGLALLRESNSHKMVALNYQFETERRVNDLKEWDGVGPEYRTKIAEELDQTQELIDAPRYSPTTRQKA